MEPHSLADQQWVKQIVNQTDRDRSSHRQNCGLPPRPLSGDVLFISTVSSSAVLASGVCFGEVPQRHSQAAAKARGLGTLRVRVRDAGPGEIAPIDKHGGNRKIGWTRIVDDGTLEEFIKMKRSRYFGFWKVLGVFLDIIFFGMMGYWSWNYIFRTPNAAWLVLPIAWVLLCSSLLTPAFKIDHFAKSLYSKPIKTDTQETPRS